MRRALLFPLLAGLGMFEAHAADVEVTLRLLTPDALEASYMLPPGCRALPFLKNGRDGDETRSGWQPLDDCGKAGGDTLDRGPQACAALRFRVPAAIEQPGYPAAFPMGQGLYVHLSNYAVGEGCGKVSYRFEAPWVAAAGQTWRERAQARGADASALLLTVAPGQEASGIPSYFDARLSPAAVDHMRKVANGTIGFLRRALPNADYQAPIVGASRVEGPGGPRVGGDAGDVLRLSLYNWPQDPGPHEQAELTKLVSHEFSHRFQLRDAVDVYPDARLIHEGGGEFLRWLTSVRQGWMTQAEAADVLDQALAKCMLGTGRLRWRDVPPRVASANGLPYECGLPAYVYLLATRQGGGTALGRVDGFYREVRLGTLPDFGRALECGTASASCRARWSAALLDGDLPMAEQWPLLLRRSGLATPRAPTPAQRDAMVVGAVMQLMRDDCGGRLDSLAAPDGMILGGMKACKTFSKDAYVTRIEGLPTFGHAGTGAALAAACSARKRVTLGLKEGATLEVPCATPYPLRNVFWHVDIAKVLAALDRE